VNDAKATDGKEKKEKDGKDSVAKANQTSNVNAKNDPYPLLSRATLADDDKLWQEQRKKHKLGRRSAFSTFAAKVIAAAPVLAPLNVAASAPANVAARVVQPADVPKEKEEDEEDEGKDHKNDAKDTPPQSPKAAKVKAPRTSKAVRRKPKNKKKR